MERTTSNSKLGATLCTVPFNTEPAILFTTEHTLMMMSSSGGPGLMVSSHPQSPGPGFITGMRNLMGQHCLPQRAKEIFGPDLHSLTTALP